MTTALEKMQQRADEARSDLVGALGDYQRLSMGDEELAEYIENAATSRMSLKILECMEEAAKGKNIDKWWELL